MKGLKVKLIFGVSLLLIFVGTLIYTLLSNILPQKIASQVLKRDVKIAEYIADEAKEGLLINDSLSLSLYLNDNYERLEDAEYLFIQAPDGKIISHTFEKGFPRGLLDLNTGIGHKYKIKEFLRRGEKIYDIAVPILGGELGALHLGVSLESSKLEVREFAKINYYIVIIIFVGLGIGVLAFNILADNLKEKIEELKRLSHLEERNRIAIEFHDVLAGDLANIIKRTELCERLFKIDQMKAFSELEDLRENTKSILDRTRKLILDLRSPADEDFDLLHNLNNFVEDFQVQNGISVSLDMPGSVSHLSAEKARTIFYIIAEAFTNIRKHSLAKNVDVKLYIDDDALTINIKDDGKGFDADQAQSPAGESEKLGLISMRERANSLGGTFSIESAPGSGTHICVGIPLLRR